MTFARIICPSIEARFLTGLRSTWEPGRKARTPTSTESPPLTTLDHLALDRGAAVVGLGNGVPDLDLVRLVLAEDDQPLAVLLGLEVDLDLVADLREGAGVAELLHGDGSLALVADVHEHFAVADLDHPAADDLPFLDVAHAAVEPILHALFGGVCLLLLRPFEDLRLPVLRLHILGTSSLDGYRRGVGLRGRP
jgi:hypothetical protein